MENSKGLKTMSMCELYKNAYSNILFKWSKACKHNEEFKKQHGRNNKIQYYWIDKYWKQLEELHEIIFFMEKEQNNKV